MIAISVVISVLISSGAAVAIVYRRQRSVDAQTAKSVDDSEKLNALYEAHKALHAEHTALQADFDKVKLMVPRPQGR